jgi:hypothetical protein
MIFESGNFVSTRTTRGREAKPTGQFLVAMLISMGVFVAGCAQRPSAEPNLGKAPAPKGQASAAERQALVDAAAAKPLACGSTQSSPSNIGFHDAVVYSATSFVGDAQSTWSFKWSVTNHYTMGHSGNLRAELYAMPESATADSFGEAGWSGHRIAIFYPNFTGDGIYSTDQLNALFHWDDIVGSVTTTNPPIGKYCIVAFLFERKDSCKENDHYCWDAWTQFPSSQLFN